MIISGVGMVSAVGLDVKTSCASLRCNLSRAVELESLEIWDSQEEESVPVIGNAVFGVSSGFSALGRWIELGLIALGDLQNNVQASLSGINWRKTGLIICLPVLDNGRFQLDGDEESIIINRFRKFGGFSIDEENCIVISKGHTGVAHAINLVEQKNDSGEWDHAIVLGVDSLVDSPSLAWANESKVLKTPDFPAGFIPGEAAACFLLETSFSNTKQFIPVVGCADIKMNGFSLNEEKGAFGDALSVVIGKAIDEVDAKSLVIGDIICDQNGELNRARQWANANVLLKANGVNIQNVNLVSPAQSFGETGAASAAVGLCVAVQSFSRSYSTSSCSAVISSGVNGEVSAFVVERNME